jgi:YD repeat-containing protein
MANMVQYQQSYNAAAKLIAVVDEMLNTLINVVGG